MIDIKRWQSSRDFYKNDKMKKLISTGIISILGGIYCGQGEAASISAESQSILWSWFPSEQAQMGKMISEIDLLGAVAIQEHALIKDDPSSIWVQNFKTNAAHKGFYYVFHTAYTMASLDNRVTGMESLEQFFTSSFAFRWNVISEGKQMGTWINFQIDSCYPTGRKNPGRLPLQSGIGSATNPNSGITAPQGSYLKEVAVAQSFLRGNMVALAGMLGDTNYFDVNRYAGTQYGMFMNSAFGNGMIMPAVSSNLGVILQYQVNDSLYVMGGVGTNNSLAGENPFSRISRDNVSYMTEIGWSDRNAFGIGYGIYKLQPFVATVEGRTQPGIALNLSQDLGSSPFSVFARAGVGGSAVTVLRGAQTQVSGGLVIKRPLKLLGLVEEDSSNFFGIAAVWSETAHRTAGLSGREETALEFNYSIQMTPTMIIQPNFQLYFNPAYNPSHSFASVFQLQVSINW